MLHRWTNRAIASLLALCMLLACCAFATEIEVAPTEGVEAAATVEAAAAAESEAAVEPEAVIEPEAAAEPAAEPTEEAAQEPAAEPAEEAAQEPATEPAEETAAEPATEAPVDAPVEMQTLAETPEGLADEGECAHERVRETEIVENDSCTPKDSKFHIVTGHMWIERSCVDCGERLESIDEGETSRVAAHTFYDGLCEACEYENECAHKYTSKEEIQDWPIDECTPVDETYHIIRFEGKVYQCVTCLTCGEELEYEVVREGIECIEAHEFFDDDNECWRCGYTRESAPCPHENTVEEREIDSRDAEIKSSDENGHTLVIIAEWVDEICQDCGAFVNGYGVRVEPYEVTEGHILEGGRCATCGYAPACAHKNTTVDTIVNDELMSKDEKGHTVAIYRRTVTICKDCGSTLEDVSDSLGRLETSEHSLENGVCTVCGYAKCAHENVDGWEDLEVDSCTPKDGKLHTLTGHMRHVQFCEDCGETLVDTVDEEETSREEAHSFENDVCTECGYKNECAHERVSEWDYIDAPSYATKDSKFHIETGHMRHEKTCVDCGETFEITVDEEETSRVVAHSFEDGECVYCNYVSGCAHKYTSTSMHRYYSDDRECTPVDAVYHIFPGNLCRETYCLTCGEELKIEEIKEGIECLEEHDFTDDGSCYACGYKSACRHENIVEEEYPDTGDAEIKSLDENGHTLVISAMWVDEVCQDCGKLLSDRRVNIEPVEKVFSHYIEGECCVTCGYAPACEHKNTIVDPIVNDKVVSKNEKGHTVAIYRQTGTFCEDCGSALDYDVDYIGRLETSAHSFKDGVCTVCGYKKAETKPTMPTVTDEPIVTAAPTNPAVTDEPIAEPTPAPVYEEVPAAEAVHGVKAEDAQPIAETMISVAEALETESEETAVRIVNVEKVLATEELTALNALPVKEQMLTFLSAIGFEDQVNRTLEARQESLSAESEALKEQIQARIAAMDDAARAEFEAALLASFPRETIVIDGVEYEFFVLEIEVQVGDTVRYERYGFRREGDQWLFTRLEIGE